MIPLKQLDNGFVAESVQRLLEHQDHEGLRDLLGELQPFDVATLLREFEEPEQLRILSLAPVEIAAEALEHLDFDNQYRLLDHSDEARAKEIIAAMGGDAVADLVMAIHPRQAQEILGMVPERDLASIQYLMTYPESSAGGLMSLDYIAVRQDWTVDRVIERFRKVGRDASITNYVYIVDRQGRLAGVTSLKEVLLSDPKTPVSEIMYTKVVDIPVDSDQEEAAKLLSRYDFVALPVVNGAGRLVGVITVDDILDVIEEEDTEDIHKLGGSQPLDVPYMSSSLMTLFSKRIGWLLVLFIAEALTGNILKTYEDVLSQVVALTFFIPLLTDTGGNSGSQASTLIIRAMALGEVTIKDLGRILWREMRVGAILGLAMGTVGFFFSWVIGGSIGIAFTVSITLMAVLVVSSTIGAALPIIGTKFGVDPAVFSAPLITTVVDATGLLIYFKIASMVLKLG
ncbi:MAG: magnesium transporter [Bacillota bacterium]